MSDENKAPENREEPKEDDVQGHRLAPEAPEETDVEAHLLAPEAPEAPE